MSDSLFIIAKITPKIQYFTIAKQTILKVVKQTLEEEGCRQFSVHQCEMSLYLYEEWDDQAALDKHYSMSYITSVFESYKQWLAQPVEINKMSKIG